MKGERSIANKDLKVPENVPGPYYVDEECIACELCVDTAPDHFRMAEHRPQAYVFKQPETDEEKDFCEDAMGACPVDAIGNDG